MTTAFFQTSQDIAAPAAVVWRVLSRIADWPAWNPTVSSIEPLDGPELRPGARFTVRQPRLRPATWRVSSIEPNEGFTWIMRTVGVTASAFHRVSATSEYTSMVVLSIGFSGPMAAVIWLLVGRITRRYVVREALSLKRASEQAFRP